MALVSAHVIYSQPEADVVVAMLRAYGIEATAFGRTINRMSPQMAVGFGGIAIMVPEQQADDARDLIAARKPASLEGEAEAFHRSTGRAFFGILLSWFYSVWMPMWTRKRRWKDEDER